MRDQLRIVSLLPSATELACALGLSEYLVGISHECDYPPEIRSKPVVVHSALPVKTMTLGEIDVAVSQQLAQGQSLYVVDESLLCVLAPTHLLTQDLCQVCAPSGNEVTRVLQALPSVPQVLWMSPHSIAEIYGDLTALGVATGREHVAEGLIAENLVRLGKMAGQLSGTEHRPRVFCAEWTDPLYCSGHWVPEQVEIAGGHDILGRKWADSVRVSWEQLVEAAPEVVIIMPCGFGLAKSVEFTREFLAHPMAAMLPAVRNGRVYAVDAAYFSRPGLRVVDGVELLGHLLHPLLFDWNGDQGAYARVGR